MIGSVECESLGTQKDLVHCRSVIIQRHNMWKNQFTGLAPGMRTWVVQGKSFQVSLNLIHHLVAPSVLSGPPLARFAFVTEAEDALRRLAHQGRVLFHSSSEFSGDILGVVIDFLDS